MKLSSSPVNIVFLYQRQSIMNQIPRYTIAHLPFLRLLLPLAAGIVWQYVHPSLIALSVCLTVAFVSVVIVAATFRDPLSPLHRYSFSIAVMAVMVTAGMGICHVSLPSGSLPVVYPESVAVARLKATPVQRRNSLQVRAEVIVLDDNKEEMREVKIPVLLYLKSSYTATRLQSGDLILFHPQLRRIQSSQAPYSFDFAGYMGKKGVMYTQYLSDGQWRLSQYTARLSLFDRAQRIQNHCVEVLYRMGLSSDNTSLLSALIWGYKQNVPATLRDCFSAAGLSHILAVSGLHTGIIAFLLWLLFFPLRYTSLRYMQGPATLLLLWGYAFVTGLSPSVVRSCIMASFVGVAAMIHRRNTSLNALFGSAVMVLVVSPLQLFDIGFQLSYAAVGGIILFGPFFDIARRFAASSVVLRYVSGLFSVSLAAQLSTLPIVIYYFHYFPAWGLLANLFLVPLLPLLVLSALLAQLFTFFGVPCMAVVSVTDGLMSLIIRGADSISALPGAVIGDIWVTLPMVVGYIFFLFCLWYMLSRKTFRALLPLLAIIVFMQFIALYESLRPCEPLAWVSAENRHTVLQMNDDGGQCFAVTTAGGTLLPDRGKEWRMRDRLSPRLVLPQDTLSTSHMYVALPFISYYGKTILWVNDNSWRYTLSNDKYPVDYAIVTELYKGKIADLVRTFDIGHIVLSEALYPDRGEQLQKECGFLNIRCTNVRDKGIWRLDGFKQ